MAKHSQLSLSFNEIIDKFTIDVIQISDRVSAEYEWQKIIGGSIDPCLKSYANLLVLSREKISYTEAGTSIHLHLQQFCIQWS